MLDTIGTVALTAGYAVVIGVTAGFARADRAKKSAAVTVAALWGSLVVVTAAAGGFAPGAAGPIPAPGFAFAGFLALLFSAWFFMPDFRAALLSVPLPVLIALNIGRIGGLFFLLLAADGRLPAPFAPSAGWGDIITGLAALPLAFVAWRGTERSGLLLSAWNLFGTADLIVAVSLGLLSANGSPLRVFMAEPGTQALTQLPWIIVPALLVPFYLLIHLAVATKLSVAQRTSPLGGHVRQP